MLEGGAGGGASIRYKMFSQNLYVVLHRQINITKPILWQTGNHSYIQSKELAYMEQIIELLLIMYLGSTAHLQD